MSTSERNTLTPAGLDEPAGVISAALPPLNLAITGANGSVGIHLLRHLAGESDIHALACVRSEQAATALPSAPNIARRVIDYADRERLAAALVGARCVVHLAGILLESRTSTYQTGNVDSTQALVDACKKAAVSHIVLVSVLGADRDSSNRYLRSKGQAEDIVNESGLSATIIRTPILLGPGTAGASALVRAATQRTVSVLGGGRHSIRPLDVDDLSRAILQCCRAPKPGVTVYDLVGPESIRYRDAIVKTATLMGKDVTVRSMPVWLAKLGAAMMGLTKPGGLTPTVIDVITSSEIVHENADAALRLTLTPLSTTLAKLLPVHTPLQMKGLDQ